MAHALAIAEGMTIDAVRMRATWSLAAASSWLKRWQRVSRRRWAVRRRIMRSSGSWIRALADGKALGQALRDDAEMRRHLSDEQIERLTDPAAYLGLGGRLHRPRRRANRAARLIV